MRRVLALLVFLLAPLAAHAACLPSGATTGMIGCEPVAPSMANTDLLQVWLPGVFPQSAQIITRTNMLAGAVATLSTLTVTGATALQGVATAAAKVTLSGTPTSLVFTPPNVTAATAQSNGYMIEQDITYALPSGASSIYFGNEFNASVSGGNSGAQVWNNLFRVFDNSTVAMDVVNGDFQTIRASADPAPGQTMWGLIINPVDETGLNSNLAGGMLALEIDMAANDADNGSAIRQGITFSLAKTNGVGVAAEAHYAVAMFANDGSYFDAPIEIATPFKNAAIDTRSAGLASGGTNNALWMRTSQQIAFDTAGNDVISTDTSSIASSIPFRSPNYNLASLPVMSAPEHGSVAYCDNCLTLSGMGGGVQVVLNSAGEWFTPWGTAASTSNQPVDIAGAVVLSSTLTVPAGTGYAFSGASTAITTDNATITSNIPYRMPGYVVTSLPTLAGGEVGATAYCTNCLTMDGMAGGTPAFLNTAGNWVTAWGTTPSTSNQAVGIAGAITLGAFLTFQSSTTGANSQTYTNSPCANTTTAHWIPIAITGQVGTLYLAACQ